MLIKKILFSPWILLVIGFSIYIFAYIANIYVSEASPNIPNLEKSGILYLFITVFNFAIKTVMTAVYFCEFWGVIYGIYFLSIGINKLLQQKRE